MNTTIPFKDSRILDKISTATEALFLHVCVSYFLKVSVICQLSIKQPASLGRRVYPIGTATQTADLDQITYVQHPSLSLLV